MLAQAMDAANVVWEDKTLRQDLTNFAWDYVKAQHAVELTQMGGGAALEVVITAILAALTAGAGAGLAVATAAKTRHLPKLRKLGDLLLEFVEQSKKLARYLKEKAQRAAKGKPDKPLDAEPVVERVNEPPKGPKVVDPKVPTPEEVRLAKSTGDSLHQRVAREKVSRHFMENNGFSLSQIDDALGSADGSKNGGVDISKPVEVVSFPPPEYMTQYVKSHGYPGNWFDPLSNQDPGLLGISGETRTKKVFKVVPGQGLKSYAKPVIDDWTSPDNPVATPGGGVQLYVNDQTKSAISALNPKGV